MDAPTKLGSMRQKRLALLHDGTPVIDVSFFQDLSRLTETLCNLTEREGHRVLSPILSADISVILTAVRYTFNLLLFINADERRDSDPFYRLGFSFVSLPLVRSMIDGLFNVSLLLTHPERADEFRLSGFKNMMAAIQEDEQNHSGEAKWTEYSAQMRRAVEVGRKAAGFSDEEMQSKVSWPTLGRYLQGKSESDTDHQRFIRQFTYGAWRQYSEISHMSARGLHDIYAYLNIDSAPVDRREKIRVKSELEIAMHLGRAATVLLAAITETQAKFRFQGHNVNQRIRVGLDNVN